MNKRIKKKKLKQLMKQQKLEHDAEIVFHKMNAVYKSLGLGLDSCFMASTLSRAYTITSDTEERTKLKEGADYLYENIDMLKALLGLRKFDIIALMNHLNIDAPKPLFPYGMYVKNSAAPSIPKEDIPQRRI